MLLFNTSLLLSDVQFFSTDNKYMECLVNIQLRTRIHIIVTSSIHIFSATIYLSTFIAAQLYFFVSPGFRRFIYVNIPHIRLWPISVHDRYLYVSALVIKELTTTLIYVLLAFLCKWFELTNKDYRITSHDFRWWLIEGSYTHHLLGSLILEYYVGWIDTVFEENQLYSIFALTIKLPVFILMRCAESDPDFFLNRFEYSLIRHWCKSR